MQKHDQGSTRGYLCSVPYLSPQVGFDVFQHLEPIVFPHRFNHSVDHPEGDTCCYALGLNKQHYHETDECDHCYQSSVLLL